MVLSDIAVGLDGSAASSDALRWASGLAEAVSANVRAIGSWRMPLVASMPSVVGALPSRDFMAEQCAETLDKAIAKAHVDADAVEKNLREGDAGAILAEETKAADLVVVGRTGSGRRRGVSRVAEVLLGSTARYCIHHASGPVAAVPSGQPWVEKPSVVVGVDGSPASHAALAFAAGNLPQSSTIYALRAVTPYVDGLLAFDHGVLDRILEATDRELDESIQTAVGPLGDEAVARIEPLVIIEDARYALIEPEFDVDIIVVGERGRSGLASRVLGSVSDHTVRNALCPVIVVPADRSDQ